MYKIGIGISILFFWNKKSVSVLVCYLILKIGIGIGTVQIFNIGKNRFKVSRSIPINSCQTKLAHLCHEMKILLTIFHYGTFQIGKIVLLHI